MKRFLLLASATLCIFAASCSQPEVSVSWIEDKPGPSVQDPHIFGGVPDSLVAELGIAEGIPSSMSAILMQIDGKNILFDAGLGAPFSQLIPSLEAKGLTPEDIDYVFITHMHPDHIGGLLKDGQIVFTGADVYINRVEAEAWPVMPQGKGPQPRTILDTYGDRIKHFEIDDELPLGIKAIAAYGHTPGHTCFLKDKFLIISDLLHGAALQLPHPEFCAFFDMNKEQAVASRIEILKYAKDNGLTVYGHHLPAPGFIDFAAE